MSGQTPEQILQSRFGHPAFRPGQQEAIDALLGGRDVVAVMPTGSGKSLCYQVPALLLPGVTLVISPLIALMKDQVDALTALGLPATFVNSSISAAEQRRRLGAMAAGEFKLVYVAPERFRSDLFLRELERSPPSLVAIDEAHCISEWGHDFRPDYRRMAPVVARARPAPVIACTATATEQVRDDIAAQLGLARPTVLVRGFRRPNLFLGVERSRSAGDKARRAAGHLREGLAGGGGGLVYCATRKRTEQVAQRLRDQGISAEPYHAGLDAELRQRVQERFMADKLPVVVATNAFGMGVDKPDVRVVIHHDLPRSPEAYYQEVGRAGRDGRPSRCAILYNHGDTHIQLFLIERSTQPRPEAAPDGDDPFWAMDAPAHAEAPFDPELAERRAERERSKLRQMVSFCTGFTCRHVFLLDYFGDEDRAECGDACDRCLAGSLDAGAPLTEGQVLVIRKALSAVARMRGRFGARRVAQVLTGSRDRKILDAGLEHLPTFGALPDWTADRAVELLDLLALHGCIRSVGREYPTVALTELGGRVMRDEASVQIPWPEQAAPERRERRQGRGEGAAGALAGDHDPAVFDRLRDARARLAREAGVPAYVVAHDRALADVAARMPATEAELLECHGFGPARVERYGRELLDSMRVEAAES